jgi:hypothetical protein
MSPKLAKIAGSRVMAWRGPVAACLVVALSAGLATTVTRATEATLDDQVGLPHFVIEDAEAWQRYVTDAANVKADFRDGGGVRSALKVGATWEPAQLEEGEVAYAALIALQDHDFVETLRTHASDPARNEALARRLMDDPASIYELPGATKAAALASTVLTEEGRRVFNAGADVKKSAYTIQHQSWSLAKSPDAKARLALVKKLSADRFLAKPADTDKLRAALVDLNKVPDTELPGSQAAPVVTRGLALAALAVLGRAQDSDAVHQLLVDPDASQCFRWAKLNLFQCLAVAGPKYEDVFCLAEHGLKEPATCVTSSTKAAWRHDKSWTGGGYAALSARPAIEPAAVAVIEKAGKGKHGKGGPVHASTHHAAGKGKGHKKHT